MNYNFVSNGKDSLKDAAFFVDENIGYSQVYIFNLCTDFICVKTKFSIGRDGHHCEGDEEDRGYHLYQVQENQS